MRFVSCVILEHYPQYEERAVNSAKYFDEIILIKDYDIEFKYEDRIRNKLKIIKSGNSLLEKMLDVVANTIGKNIMLLDGDDYFSDEIKSFLYTVRLTFMQDEFIKLRTKNNIFYFNRTVKDVVTILNKNYDWNISGTMFYNDGKLIFTGNRSIDKQLMFNAINKKLDISIITTNGLIKTNNDNSVMNNIERKEFEKDTINGMKSLISFANSDIAYYYLSLVVQNSLVRSEKLSFRLIKYAILTMLKFGYYKPLLNLMVKL